MDEKKIRVRSHFVEEMEMSVNFIGPDTTAIDVDEHCFILTIGGVQIDADATSWLHIFSKIIGRMSDCGMRTKDGTVVVFQPKKH
jgi:hypothetical protein